MTENKLLRRFLFLKQLKCRYDTITNLIAQKRGLKPLDRVQIWNAAALVVLDVVLGCAVTYYVSSLTLPELGYMIEVCLAWVLDVLQWLRGTPAGLKLNAALNSILCRFFSYHLHLWRYYLNIISPVLTGLLTLVLNMGCLGVTLQIALLKDVVVFATFHVYCLYIYATRLFNVQGKVVISLGRLFFGKKYNPLRNRVDSVHVSLSEMFLGCLGFLIGAFLMPTTAVYYFVFLGLRVPVQVVEWFLRVTVEALESLQLATGLLSLIQSPLVADEVYFESKHKQSAISLNVDLYLKYRCSKPVIQLPDVGKSLALSFKQILQGVVMQD